MGYEELLVNIPQNMQYFLGSLIVTSNYSNLTVQRKPFKPDLKSTTREALVELGYNLQLQKKEDDAKFTTTKRLADSRKTQMKFTVSPVHSRKKYY
jgi:hypothetical protein